MINVENDVLVLAIGNLSVRKQTGHLSDGSEYEQFFLYKGHDWVCCGSRSFVGQQFENLLNKAEQNAL